MSIQWTFIAGLLYFEVVVVLLLVLPILSAKKWNKFFKSGLFQVFKQRAAIFYVLLGVLCLFLLDAIREIRKYSQGMEAVGHLSLATDMKGSVKLFRAQRNFYLTGFTIFLSFVIRRLIKMLITQAELSKKAEDSIKEAEAKVNSAKTAILADTLEASEKKHNEFKEKIQAMEDLLNAEVNKVKELEEDLKIWKRKYEEAAANTGSVGRGDE